MTRVDFYLLKDTGNAAGPLFTCCRLAEKAYMQGHRIFINTESALQLQQLDDLLWTFRDGSFLPHAICGGDNADEQPILLGHDSEPRNSNDVLITLTHDVPAFFSRFNRVAELVDGDDTRRAAARERYRFYKDRGYTLNTHEIG